MEIKWGGHDVMLLMGQDGRSYDLELDGIDFPYFYSKYGKAFLGVGVWLEYDDKDDEYCQFGINLEDSVNEWMNGLTEVLYLMERKSEKKKAIRELKSAKKALDEIIKKIELKIKSIENANHRPS